MAERELHRLLPIFPVKHALPISFMLTTLIPFARACSTCFTTSGTFPRVALDKDEGFVKAQITRAVRLHRLSFQRG